MVFYFTATGNSLFVAKQLEENPISIPQIIHSGAMTFKDDTIGIVCPLYGSELPGMVKDFLKQAHFDTDYFYIVMTYGCNNGAAPTLIRQFATEANLHLDYFRTVKMVDNFLPGFDMSAEKDMDKHIDQQLNVIKTEIAHKRRFLEEQTEDGRQVYEGYLAYSREHPDQTWKAIKFHSTDACVSCGICTKVCPAGCIHLENGRAVHRDAGCQVCMACIHACPNRAIQASVPEVNPYSRYCNENISLLEIIQANRQGN